MMPIYNWYYPLVNDPVDSLESNPHRFFSHLDSSKIKSRALYFHIPFCTSICSFCPFVKMKAVNDGRIERYTKALITEIELKAAHDSVSSIPIGAIFFGGGSPSVLSPNQIVRIGETIRTRFDLSEMREFSFEMSVADITTDKVAALREIGVTNARFGVQSFNPVYRNLFDLTTTISTIKRTAKLLSASFPNVSFDMLYGMDGQTHEEFLSDIEEAVSLGIRNIAFYPINNLVTQIRLHRKYEKCGRFPTSGIEKHRMNVILNRVLRRNGFLPHNGHEFVKVPEDELVPNPVLTSSYTFYYHKHVYGYSDHDMIGFGTNALSSSREYIACNTASLDSYIEKLLKSETWDFRVGRHGEDTDASKGVILHLPYFGHIDKNRIDWDMVFPETTEALQSLVEIDMINETGSKFELTHEGWLSYVNLMYFLSPSSEKRVLDSYIEKCSNESGRRVENCTLRTHQS